MGIGIVTEEEFNNEVKKLNGDGVTKNGDTATSSPKIIDIDTRGRKNGDNNVPDSLRKIIGETGAIDGRQEAIALAEMFGVSKSSTSAYTNGATSTASYDKPKKSILEHINKHKERIVNKATSRLDSALDNITEEKLKDLSVLKLASVAKDMSAIVKNMEPEVKDTGDEEKPRFVVFAPQFVKEEHFETIILREE